MAGALGKLNSALAEPKKEAPAQQGDLTPEQTETLKRVSLMAQAALADETSGDALIEQASKGQEGLFAAVSGVLKLVNEKMKLPRELIVPAGVTILIIVLKFLTDIGKAQAGPEEIGKLSGALAVVIGQEYGFSPEEISQMTGAMPSEGGTRQAANTQRAMAGPLGQMMQQGGQPPAEQPPAPTEEEVQ